MALLLAITSFILATIFLKFKFNSKKATVAYHIMLGLMLVSTIAFFLLMGSIKGVTDPLEENKKIDNVSMLMTGEPFNGEITPFIREHPETWEYADKYIKNAQKIENVNIERLPELIFWTDFGLFNRMPPS